MASNWISDVQWDAQGRPFTTFLMDGPGYKKGDKRYISPSSVSSQNDYGKDPRLAAWARQTGGAPGASLLRERGQWNPRTGQWDRHTNWGNIASMGAGALIAGPAIAGALAGGGGAPAAVAPAVTGGAAPTAAATTGAAATTAATTGGGMAGGLWGTRLTYADLISGGANVFDKLYSAHAASAANATNDAALREALAFTKQQYADQTAREQARFDATEARRVPYRAASQDTLAEFRKLLGI